MEIAMRSHVSSSLECTRQMLPVSSYLPGVPKLAKSEYIPENLIVSNKNFCDENRELMSYLPIYIYIKDFCIKLTFLFKKEIKILSSCFFSDMKNVLLINYFSIIF